LSENKKELSDWDVFYKQKNTETIPWYGKKLDVVEKIQFLEKGKFLDLGTVSGTPAVELAKKGFTVTSSGIIPSAIEKAKDLTNFPKMK